MKLNKPYLQIGTKRREYLYQKIKSFGIAKFSKLIGDNRVNVYQRLSGKSILNDVTASYYETKIKELTK